MPLGDALDDRQPQPAAFLVVAGDAEETLAQPRQQLGRDAGAVVLDAEAGATIGAYRQPHGDGAAAAGITHGVVDQVVQQVQQAGGVAQHEQRLAAAFVAQIHASPDCLVHAVGDRLGNEAGEIEQGALAGFQRGRLRARQRQQLCGRARGAAHQPLDVEQGVGHRFRLRVGDGVFDVQAQPGQRRAQLVRGIGDEAVVQGQHAAQTGKQRVDGPCQWPDLQRYVGAVDRREFVVARGEPGGQRVEHAQAAAHAEPDQRKHAGDQQGLHHDRQQQDFACLLVAVVQRLGNGDDQAVAGFTAHRDAHRRRAQGVFLHLQVVERRRGADGRRLRRFRQSFVAGQQAVPGAAHVEIATAFRVVFEQEACLWGHVAAELLVADHGGQGHGIIAQVAIVHPVGVAQRHAIGQQRIQQQQHADRHQQGQQEASAQAGPQLARARRVHAWPFPLSSVSSSR